MEVSSREDIFRADTVIIRAKSGRTDGTVREAPGFPIAKPNTRARMKMKFLFCKSLPAIASVLLFT